VNAVLQGFLPGLALSLFLLVPAALAAHALALWRATRRSRASSVSAAGKYYYFMVVSALHSSNVLAGSTFGNIKYFSSNPTQ